MHDALFEITEGYYYNDGRNNKINKVVEDLYNLKLKLKRDNNPAQMVITLLMNSMYGKTIIKPVETDTIVKDNKDDFEIYISYMFNHIGSVLEVNVKRYTRKVNKFITL